MKRVLNMLTLSFFAGSVMFDAFTEDWHVVGALVGSLIIMHATP